MNNDFQDKIVSDTTLWHYYIITTTGGLQRATLPWSWYYFAAYLQEDHDEAGVTEAWMDDLIRYVIDRRGGSYSEGALEALHRLWENEGFRADYLAWCEVDRQSVEKLIDGFNDKQAILAKQWRESTGIEKDPIHILDS